MNSGSGGLPPAAIRYGAVATGLATDGGGCPDPFVEFGSHASDMRRLPAAIGHQPSSDETRFDMTKSLKELSQRSTQEIKAEIVAGINTEHIIEDAAYAINANADFLYNLGADTQLEAVGEDDLDAHMSAPIFAQLTMESQAYLRDEDFPTTDPSGWDVAEDYLETMRRRLINYAWAVVLGLTLAGIGWLELVSAA